MSRDSKFGKSLNNELRKKELINFPSFTSGKERRRRRIGKAKAKIKKKISNYRTGRNTSSRGYVGSTGEFGPTSQGIVIRRGEITGKSFLKLIFYVTI